jgi:RHH-type proline utilization regulon transcriptional repressor/proline dehydrogenase/delta 1-pyrroline-5-carboxylate dehydrogenase
MEPGSAQDAVKAKGLEIFRLMGTERPALFDRGWWAGRTMEIVMRDPALKVPLFRFVDVLPALTDGGRIARHAKEYFSAGKSPLPRFVDALLSAAASGPGTIPGSSQRPASGPAAALAAIVVKRGVARFSKTFIAGETPEKALKPLRRLLEEGKTFTVDILGEAVVSETEADTYRDLYLRLADTLAREITGRSSPDPRAEQAFPRLNISVKISSLYSRIGPVNHGDSVKEVRRRLRPILAKVREAGGFVNLDMEMHSLKDITLDVFMETLDTPEFHGWEGAGIALQAYHKCAERDLLRLIGWAEERNRRITVRLVKGAYWEYETVVARQKGWEIPVFPRKTHTDANFERLVELALENHQRLTLAVGSHNVRSIAKALVTAENLNVPRERYEFQMLYGMAEPVKRALKAMGFPVREYVPIGELLPGMAYLVRRLLENSSNEGFLRKAFAGRLPPEELLAEPERYVQETPGAPGTPEAERTAPFSNEPAADFTMEETRVSFRDALAHVGRRMGESYPAVIGGKEYREGEPIVSVDPARPTEVVGIVHGIGRELADKAVSTALNAQKDWSRRAPEDRAKVLFRAAAAARRRRIELAAWQVREAGKSWTEADADVAEAVDYLEYYGREMVRLGKPVKLGDLPGEENLYLYRPRGVGLVVAPWNFPLAISIGMTSAALVAGNAVLYKPSSLSPVNGWLAFSLLREGGAPDGALNFIPGKGGVVGDRLVGHPGVDFIAFTGSRAVGLGIVERAGRTSKDQKSVKRAIVEMGGKNAILVDADADLDQAVPAVIRSAFGYQGQKCSACSRVIVHSACYDRFLSRLCEAVKGMTAGPPEDPANMIGPVIDHAAKEKTLAYIALGKTEGRIAVEIPVPADGYYVSPTVVTDLPPDSRILSEEIFGPVLAVIRARDIEEAVAVANSSDYALTGGLFSRSPSTIARVSETFAVGNLYINRGITGAMVGRQPFGGFRMSGVGSKAGGPDYLLQFMEPRVVTENTMRRGFSPDVL